MCKQLTLKHPLHGQISDSPLWPLQKGVASFTLKSLTKSDSYRQATPCCCSVPQLLPHGPSCEHRSSEAISATLLTALLRLIQPRGDGGPGVLEFLQSFNFAGQARGRFCREWFVIFLCAISRRFRLPPPHQTIPAQQQGTNTAASCVSFSFDCCCGRRGPSRLFLGSFGVTRARPCPGLPRSNPISTSRSRQPLTPILALVFGAQSQVPISRIHRKRQILPVKPLRGSFKCFSAGAPSRL